MAVRRAVPIGIRIRILLAAAAGTRSYLVRINRTVVAAVRPEVAISIPISQTAAAGTRSYFVRIIGTEVLAVCGPIVV